MKMSLLTCLSLVVLMLVGTGCYEVLYTAEYKGDSCIKFDNAMSYDEGLEEWVEACLGEDGAVEADGFYVELDGYTEDVEVSVKAGQCKETVTLEWDDIEGLWSASTECGFTILGLPVLGEDAWVLGVISDDVEGGKDGTAALSNVTFCFGDDVSVTGPEEGEFYTYRAEGEEEIEEAIEGIREDLED